MQRILRPLAYRPSGLSEILLSFPEPILYRHLLAELDVVIVRDVGGGGTAKLVVVVLPLRMGWRMGRGLMTK